VRAGAASGRAEVEEGRQEPHHPWMGGGPSHMDLWDLKPGASTAGEFRPMKTAASGIEISQILPKTAGQFKHLSVIRSLVTNEGSHERGTTLMNTGRQPSPVVTFPAMGAVASSLFTSKDAPLPVSSASAAPRNASGRAS